MHLVIVSGRSGAGKSSVLGALEDLDFYCIDNLPVALLNDALMTLSTVSPGRNLAVSIDIRTLGLPADVPALVESLGNKVSRLDILFIDASDKSLSRRFSETRRLHPISSGIERIHLSDALKQERVHLEPIFVIATCKIDSSGLSIHALRSQIRELVAGETATQLMLKIQSFGFKNGIPMDSDTVFDARALPNPYWEQELQEFTGQHRRIGKYLEQFSDTAEFLNSIEGHVRYWTPRHAESGCQYFTISIGCTGGQHRSVYIAEALSQRLNDLNLSRQVVHRELASG